MCGVCGGKGERERTRQNREKEQVDSYICVLQIMILL